MWASAHDFVVVTNDLSAGIRSVGFAQSISGVPVVGGQLSVRFKRDRMFVVASEALPHVSAALPAVVVGDSDATSSALDHIVDLYGGSPTAFRAGLDRGPVRFALADPPTQVCRVGPTTTAISGCFLR